MGQQKSSILALILSCIFFILINGQDNEYCEPGPVENLQLTESGTLTWDTPDSESCEIAQYTVSVSISGTDEQRTYTVTEPLLDLGDLTPCVRYDFQVRQVSSDNVAGSAAAIHTITPPPPEANLTLQHITIVPVGRNIRLEWSVNDDWVQCAERYRLVIVNEVTNTAADVYTTTTAMTVIGLVPCVPYTFTVAALFTLEEGGPPTLVRHVAPAAETSSPTLESFTLGTRSLDLVIGLERFNINGCPIYEVLVDASPTFTASYPVSDQSTRMSFPISITDLQPANLYYLRISANNTFGVTSPLQVAFQTLESN
ncbi:hypothetical protein NQ318_017903 [Aromia moschata]|uniref:Fibronectin type-III domain-containing protein n=1 Tax=Aromia moschata TaxID=1265417 RepID=A0AAV8YBV5_9CUCU|nr:hypothetical protein NQ318_017903 [Aromia moschata]